LVDESVEHDITGKKEGLQIVYPDRNEFPPNRISISKNEYDREKLTELVEEIENEDDSRLSPLLSYFKNILRLQEITGVHDRTDPYDIADVVIARCTPFGKKTLEELVTYVNDNSDGDSTFQSMPEQIASIKKPANLERAGEEEKKNGEKIEEMEKKLDAELRALEEKFAQLSQNVRCQIFFYDLNIRKSLFM